MRALLAAPSWLSGKSGSAGCESDLSELLDAWGKLLVLGAEKWLLLDFDSLIQG